MAAMFHCTPMYHPVLRFFPPFLPSFFFSSKPLNDVAIDVSSTTGHSQSLLLFVICLHLPLLHVILLLPCLLQ